jgi:hypothetical protein
MRSEPVTDTTDFCSIDNGDEILINESRYKITGHAKENRFGLEDPKFWVKRAINVETGERKFIKLAYFESFDMTLGGVPIKCFRDPEKEGAILDLVTDHPYFMQGVSYLDSKGNNVRVIDVVHGKDFMAYIHAFRMQYDVYFRDILPGILQKILKAFEAVRFLHSYGYRHGDIRNDHLLVNSETGNLVWIDFDYDYMVNENPFSLDIFGLGNILAYAIGKGFHERYMIINDKHKYGDFAEKIVEDDFSFLDQTRFVNLRKLYPIIPATLNNILMHFSKGSEVFYETTDEIIEDLNRCLQAFY